MGNDIDVCSKDEDIEARFLRIHGSPHESTLQLILRSYKAFVRDLCMPERVQYDEHDCLDKEGIFQGRHFSIPARSQNIDGSLLRGCLWTRQGVDKTREVCIVYLHTNRRCLVDALELLPLCKEVGASLVSFDLPGCGRSDGFLTKDLQLDIASVLEWVQVQNTMLPGRRNLEVIIWARGMATSPAIDFCHQHFYQSSSSCSSSCSSSSSSSCSSIVLRCCILDTPFLRFLSLSLSLTHSLTHSLTDTHTLSHSLTHSLTHSHTHSLTDTHTKYREDY